MRKKVLIADDHAFVSWGITKALASLDVEIIGSITNGIEAIVQIRKHRPDCAVLDYNMPGANGMEVFLEAKRWSPETRFVLLTGNAVAEMLHSFVDAGIHGVCLKDCSEDEMVDVVGRTLKGQFAIGPSAQALLKKPVETFNLTDRELAVLQAVARGHTNASAAEALGVSAKTIDTHRTNLMRKLSVNSTASMLLAAVRAGILDPSGIR